MWRTRTAAPIASSLVLFVALAVVAAACGSSAPSPTPTPTGSATSPAASPSPTPSSSASATPGQPAGSPAPAGFRAASVTFVSSDEAFVLGTAPGAETVLLRTLDRGQSWVRLAAPTGITLGRPGSSAARSVWGTRFASPSHGFIFGKGLWETTDGGAHWGLDAAPSGSVLSLAAIDGQVLALTSAIPSAASATLLRRPLAGGSWTSLATVKSPGLLDPNDLISTQAGTAAVLDGTSVLVTTNGGLTVHRHATPGAAPPATPGSVAVTSSGSLALLIVGPGAAGSTGKVVSTSADLGAHWSKAGKPSLEGDGGTLAGGSPAGLLLTSASGASWIFRSTNGGKTWATALTYGDGGLGWGDLGFTTPTNAIVIHGPADRSGNGDGRPGQLLLTSNGGATWQAVTF